MILTSQQEMAWIFNREYFLELALFIFDLSLVVYLDGTNVVELDREAQGCEQPYRSWRQLVLELLYSKQPLIGT